MRPYITHLVVVLMAAKTSQVLAKENALALRGSSTIPKAPTTRNVKVKDSIASRNLRARIVGGSPASLTDFPFFVDLDGCGGSLIYEGT